MARIRTIKPEFWTHEELSALPEATHLLAAALLNYADDHGYFNANVGLVKAACSPLREPSVSIPESFRSLQTMGYLRFGTAPDGKRYGHVVNFNDHQRVSHPTPSRISSLTITWEESKNPPEKFGNPPESFRPEGKGKEGNREGNYVPQSGTTNGHSRHLPSETVSRVFDHWRTTHGHHKAQLDGKRKRLIAEALKHYSEADLLASISGYKNSPHHMGKNDSGTKYDDIEVMLRDAKHIDAGLAFGKPRGEANGLETLRLS